MRFFDQKLSFIILFFTVPLLFLPKLNLFSLDAHETAGLRIDDFILLFFGLLLMGAHLISQQKLFKIEGLILAITLFSLVSFLMNHFLYSEHLLIIQSKIFYVFRPLEYFLFFYLGALYAHHFNGQVLIRVFFLWNLCLMVLQKLNLAGGLLTAGYFDNVSGRVPGIASFPSEMGLILNLLFCWMIYDNFEKSRFIDFFPKGVYRHVLKIITPYCLFLIFGTLVIFTGNRISILTLAFCFLFYIRKDFNFRAVSSLIFFVVLIPLLTGGLYLIVKESAGVYERSIDLFSMKNIELAEIVWEKIDLTQPPLSLAVVDAENYDASWWIRIHKWIFAAKSFYAHPECYLQGLGPGFCGAALDGGLLRILVEYGVLGSFLFWIFFRCLAKINIQTQWMVIAFLFNMIFFDAYLAYKAMSLLLFMSGLAWAIKQHNWTVYTNNFKSWEFDKETP